MELEEVVDRLLKLEKLVAQLVKWTNFKVEVDQDLDSIQIHEKGHELEVKQEGSLSSSCGTNKVTKSGISDHEIQVKFEQVECKPDFDLDPAGPQRISNFLTDDLQNDEDEIDIEMTVKEELFLENEEIEETDPLELTEMTTVIPSNKRSRKMNPLGSSRTTTKSEEGDVNTAFSEPSASTSQNQDDVTVTDKGVGDKKRELSSSSGEDIPTNNSVKAKKRLEPQTDEGECSICGVDMTDWEYRRKYKHKKMHKPLKCEYCGKVIKSGAICALNRHLKNCLKKVLNS